MKTTFDNKWRIGLHRFARRDTARERRAIRFRERAVFAVTLFVSCVAFGPIIGIREPYLGVFRVLAAAGFVLALLPVAGEAFAEWRRGVLDVPTLLLASMLAAAALLSLFFPF